MCQVRNLHNLRRPLKRFRRSLNPTRRNQLVLLRWNPEDLRRFWNAIQQGAGTKLAVDLAAPHIDLAAEGEAAVHFGALTGPRPLDAVFEHLWGDRHGAARSKSACAAYLRHERPDHTLQPTALVHEAYLRLVGGNQPNWNNRAHFLAVAARAMRRALVNHALARNAEKRGGGRTMLSIDPELVSSSATDIETLDLSDAIDRLAEMTEEINKTTENIGARRLHTLVEKLLEEISFEGSELKEKNQKIDAHYVDEKLAGLIENRDLRQYIL